MEPFVGVLHFGNYVHQKTHKNLKREQTTALLWQFNVQLIASLKNVQMELTANRSHLINFIVLFSTFAVRSIIPDMFTRSFGACLQ